MWLSKWLNIFHTADNNALILSTDGDVAFQVPFLRKGHQQSVGGNRRLVIYSKIQLEPLQGINKPK